MKPLKKYNPKGHKIKNVPFYDLLRALTQKNSILPEKMDNLFLKVRHHPELVDLFLVELLQELLCGVLDIA